MSRIRVLSEQVANQIAAGEVVDRPAAVVKELVENSLDAGASRIAIEIEGAGVGLVRVADNGSGMDQDDALLSLERHATSKLRVAADLAAISSLGFRGEAIPSIASVSWFTILSRPQGASLGVRVEVRHGVLKDVRTEGCGQGTVIEARQLFANMPARKKFLKSTRTEMFHIEDAVKNLALASPEVAFQLVADGRTVLDLPASEGAEARMRRIFRYRDTLLPLSAEVAAESADGLMRVSGFLLLPEKTPTGAKLRLLVNNRAVSDNLLRYAVRDALQGYLMRGYQPAGLLCLTLPPELVDVNVHPAKREIRFRNGEAVRRLVAASVVSALKRQEQGLRESVFQPAPSESKGESKGQASSFAPPATPSMVTAEPRSPQFQPQQQAIPAQPASQLKPLWQETSAPVPPVLHGEEDSPKAPTGHAAFAPKAPPAAGPDQEFFGLRLIGQLFSLYLLCERAGTGQLVIIDQHAAHERILYGRLAGQYLHGQVAGQSLLFPETLELDPPEHEALLARQEEMAALGFGLMHFGERTWVLNQVPALTSHLESGQVLRDALHCLRLTPRQDKGEGSLPKNVAQLFSDLACKAAIKAGRDMAPQEMLDLLAQMAASRVFSHCPHGRPVVKIFDKTEVEQWFHRRE